MRKVRYIGNLLAYCFCLFATSTPCAMDLSPSPVKQPNFLLIVVDDMGYTDLGSFGGEIETPHLDALAYNGIRFTNFQAAPTCSPTRSMLLTGVDSHKAGLGNMAEELAPNQKGKPGYEGYLNHRVITVARLLRDAGYHTYMAGKWHLGLEASTSPGARGFDRTFTLLTGGASHFNDMKPAYAPTPEAKAPYRENGKKLSKLPANFHYSTRFYADRIIENIREQKETQKPFFAYLAYSAPHWPIQAPDETLAKYKGHYDIGYDAIHTQRLKKQKSLGLLSTTAPGAPRSNTPWESLSKKQQAVEARKMEIYAAMIDEIDSSTGRVINYLKENQLFENTVIIFLSDNGAEGHDLDATWPMETYPKIRTVINETHDFSIKNMGRPNSYTLIGEYWSRASSPALKGYKSATSEGGTRVPAFVHYPAQFRGKTINNDLLSVKDITPTLLELVGINPPKIYNGRQIEPITGISLVSLLSKGNTDFQSKERLLATELMGKKAIRKGDWKLVHMPPPNGINQWQLYNLKNDIAEQNDLSSKHPEKLQELKKYWQQYADENEVILPDWVSGY